MSKDKKEKEEAKKGQFFDLIKDYFTGLPKAGDVVEGKVVANDKGVIRVDIGGILIGVVRGQELFAESKEYGDLKIGDKVQATAVDSENENGEVELSFRTAGHQRVWDRMADLMKEGTTLPAKVIQANKGGLMMQIDAVAGFMPVSQLNPEHYPRVPGGDKNRILEQLRQLVGKEFIVKVIDVNPEEQKLIVSEKAVWEDDQKAVIDAYKIGDMIEGEVSALTSFGAFIKFGEGLEGLVHISEIVWQRIDHPRDILKVGDRVKAQIIDLNKSKIYLSIKRLVEDPWKSVKDKYKVGEMVEGEVHKIEPFGLMVKLDDDIHGLAHISEVSNSPVHTTDELKALFSVGQKYKFEIVNIEPAEHRLGLKVEGVKGREKSEESKTERVKKEKEEKKAGAEDEGEKAEETAKEE
jgi:small subunit ribosomal protein S1